MKVLQQALHSRILGRLMLQILYSPRGDGYDVTRYKNCSCTTTYLRTSYVWYQWQHFFLRMH